MKKADLSVIERVVARKALEGAAPGGSGAGTWEREGDRRLEL
jgi:hypothetical protein